MHTFNCEVQIEREKERGQKREEEISFCDPLNLEILNGNRDGGVTDRMMWIVKTDGMC
jgi:hypothetical protein